MKFNELFIKFQKLQLTVKIPSVDASLRDASLEFIQKLI